MLLSILTMTTNATMKLLYNSIKILKALNINENAFIPRNTAKKDIKTWEWNLTKKTLAMNTVLH